MTKWQLYVCAMHCTILFLLFKRSKSCANKFASFQFQPSHNSHIQYLRLSRASTHRELYAFLSFQCGMWVFFSASIFLNNLVVVARASAREREGAKQFTFEWECFDAVNIDENDGRVEKKRKNVRTIRTSVSVCVRVVLYNSSSSCFFFVILWDV